MSLLFILLLSFLLLFSFPCFFFNDTATTEIYTLSLHDALPICLPSCGPGSRRETRSARRWRHGWRQSAAGRRSSPCWRDRKSTRLNSSHVRISYAVFCLKKKKNTKKHYDTETERRYDHTEVKR